MTLLRSVSVPGPSALVPGTALENEIQLAGAFCAKFADHKPGLPVVLEVCSGNTKRTIEVMPAEQGVIDALRV